MAPLIGFSLITSLHFLFVLIYLSLQDKDMLELLDAEKIFMVTLSLIVMTQCLLAWTLIAKPSVCLRMNMLSEGNAVQKLCREMDSVAMEDLSRLEDVCLVCLREKQEH